MLTTHDLVPTRLNLSFLPPSCSPFWPPPPPQHLQVTDWLDYILGRVQDPPDFMMRRDSPARRKRKREGSALSGDTMPVSGTG